MAVAPRSRTPNRSGRPDALAPGSAGSRMRVVDKTFAAEGVAELRLEHPELRRLADWAPGAHIDLTLPNGTTRQYSLCGDRWDAYSYRVGVLREPDGDGGSAFVHDELSLGDTVTVGGPRNNFPLVPARRYLFVAGGIGITPLLPMVHHAAMLGADWRLLYGGRSRRTMAFLDELADYGDRVQTVPEDEHGRLDLATWLPEPDEHTKVYCCGPAPLLEAVERLTAAWPPGVLRTERFTASAPAAPVRSTPFEVELRRSGRTLTVPPDRSVLDCLAESGVAVLSSCRQGVCGTCETDVLEGTPDHRDSLLDDRERSAGDRMFVCVSRSCSDRLALDL